MKISRFSTPVLSVVAMAASLPSVAAATDEAAEQIVRNNCLACHTEEQAEAPQWSRISHQRKTPEGWLMTIARMQVMHGLKISDADRRTLVRYLADRQGLAPSETREFRYAMERRLNTQESFDSAEFTEMCARCHSGARVALQRRPAAEWEKLVHFHLGQWPTIEYQAMGRDRDWLGAALNSMVPQLASRFPLDTDAWQQWQQAEKAELDGSWRFVGNLPGRGEIEGTMVISGSDEDGYQLDLSGRYADGTRFSGSGQGVVYTGYEWRASVSVDGVAMRQVLAASEDGNRLEGRMFQAQRDEVGMDISAFRDAEGKGRILAVQPAYIRAGETRELTIVGQNLSGALNPGEGIRIDRVLNSGSDRIVVQATADSGASPGAHQLSVGASNGAEVTVYDRIGSLKVTPAFSVARVGGNGGATPKVSSVFQAEAWAPGRDGEAGTDDDLRIGMMPARWHVEPFDEAAEADRDTHFAGSMDAATGVFTPAAAGPNPERRMSTNNAGNLRVVAELQEDDRQLRGDGQLIVTVQRWNNPPLP